MRMARLRNASETQNVSWLSAPRTVRGALSWSQKNGRRRRPRSEAQRRSLLPVCVSHNLEQPSERLPAEVRLHPPNVFGGQSPVARHRPGEAKYWLEPTVAVAHFEELNQRQLKQLHRIVQERSDEIRKVS